MMDKRFYTYILLTVNNKLYCGYTDNLEKRFQRHLEGKASKFTRANKPLKIVYTREYLTKSEAMKEECRIKKLSRKQKEELIQAQNLYLK
jgi:putative endonuclease